MPRGHPIPVTPKRLAWLRKHRERMSDADLARAYAAEFGDVLEPGALATFCRRHGILMRANGGRFQPGERPWNTGRTGHPAPGRARETTFRPGHHPHTTVPVGSYRQTKDGMWLLKVSDRDPNHAGASNARQRDWRYVHRLTYEAHHGPVPPGSIVLLIDGDPDHCMDPDNVTAISRAVHGRLNQMGFPDLPKDRALRRAAIAEATLRQAAHDRARDAGFSLQERRRLLGSGGVFPAGDAAAAERQAASRMRRGHDPRRSTGRAS